MRKAKFGYCALTADFLHIGHVNFLKKCKDKCEKLCVGIMTDDCVLDYKGKKPLMSFRQRRKIVQELKMVHTTMIQETFEFPHKVMRLKFFHGKNFLIFDSAAHCRDGADFCFPYMSNISSTLKKEGL